MKQNYDAVKMMQLAEDFYKSLGVPGAAGQRSGSARCCTQPRDRDVACHASAWDMNGKDDVRIKMCIRPTNEELRTIHHELGHVYYFLWYKDQPPIFQNGAHDGFHEAIGDTITLSMTPAYLEQIGLVPRGQERAGKR